jgi:hypothetical protein
MGSWIVAYLLLKTENVDDFQEWFYCWIMEIWSSEELPWCKTSRVFLTEIHIDTIEPFAVKNNNV